MPFRSIHDIGKILLMRVNSEQYRKAIQESRQLGVSLEFAEYAHGYVVQPLFFGGSDEIHPIARACPKR